MNSKYFNSVNYWNVMIVLFLFTTNRYDADNN